MVDIEIEIDGRKLTAKPNQTVIQVADEAGIYIPRYCYHKNLSIPANCRMCLVEIEKAPKTLPACATPVTPGMKVSTRSQKTLLAQRAVMEFLLINHPLDCPICDQGGECELQDLSMGYGAGNSRYNEPKRAVPDQDLGPLIATEMTRCIYCTRCVRFGEEIAGLRELGAIGRGEFTEIATYIQQAIKSEVSGNIIDLCPVGALTSKPYRFTARPWELDQAPGISPHDCVGSNLNVHTRYGKVMRVVSHENLALNDTWISDRDRFSYAGLYAEDRIGKPMVKTNGVWRAATWEQAFEVVMQGLQASIAQHGADNLGALASPNSTLEEFYLLQKIIRALGSPHIDHRLRTIDSNAIQPKADVSLQELESADAIILLGSNIQKEQPIVGLRVRKASLRGAKIFAINPVDYTFNFPITNKKIIAPHLFPQTLQDFANSDMASQLKDKQKICIILGALANHHPEAALIHYYARQIAKAFNAKINVMTDGANSYGAWLASAVPTSTGLCAYDMLKKPRKAYLLLNVEPEKDCANSAEAKAALKQAAFVAAISMYQNPILNEFAHVILPMSAFTETSGTYVNSFGNWQSFKGSATPFEASRPAWKILRVLGNFLQLDGFNYRSSEEIKHEIKALQDNQSVATELSKPNYPAQSQIKLSRIGEIPIYAGDSLVRRSKPLQIAQKIMLGEVNVVKLHPETAKALNFANGDSANVRQHGAFARLTILIDERIPQHAAWIAGSIEETSNLGDLFGEVDITRET